LQVLDDLLGGIAWNALLQGDHLLDGGAGGRFDVAALHVLDRYAALDEARLQHVPHGLELEVVFGGGRQGVGFLIGVDRRDRALEVEALADFLARLVDGVVDLRHVDVRGDVERIRGRPRHNPTSAESNGRAGNIY